MTAKPDMQSLPCKKSILRSTFSAGRGTQGPAKRQRIKNDTGRMWGCLAAPCPDSSLEETLQATDVIFYQPPHSFCAHGTRAQNCSSQPSAASASTRGPSSPRPFLPYVLETTARVPKASPCHPVQIPRTREKSVEYRVFEYALLSPRPRPTSFLPHVAIVARRPLGPAASSVSRSVGDSSEGGLFHSVCQELVAPMKPHGMWTAAPVQTSRTTRRTSPSLSEQKNKVSAQPESSARGPPGFPRAEPPRRASTPLSSRRGHLRPGRDAPRLIVMTRALSIWAPTGRPSAAGADQRTWRTGRKPERRAGAEGRGGPRPKRARRARTSAGRG